MATKSKEVVEKGGPEIVKRDGLEAVPYIPGAEDWESTSDQVAGHDLAKDQLLDALVNVPFKVTALTFRRGTKKPGVEWDPAYVSCETVIAPEHVLKRRRVDMSMMPFEPDSQVVFNDGSTGIYRQIVAYLAAKGIISIPETLPEAGGYGETRYDLPPSEWSEIHAGELTYSDDGFAEYVVSIRLTCPRGLRLSEYENDYNPSGNKTRYLA